MFRIMRNTFPNGTASNQVPVQAIRKRLPPGWSAEIRPNGDEPMLRLEAPDGRAAILAVEARRGVQPRDIPNLLRRFAERGQPLLLIAPFLSPRAREMLIEANVSYADATGNLRIVASDPAVFLESRGADRDPERRPRPLRSLKGGAAGRVVRALCDFVPPYGVRTLAQVSSTPLGTVSRVVSLLDEEALITRDDNRQIRAVDWAALIARWVQDYTVSRSNILRSYIEPRGLVALGTKINKLPRYAMTGSLAGPGTTPARLAMVYVDDAPDAAETLEIVPTEAGINVWLLEPFDDVVFERTVSRPFGPSLSTTVTCAAPSQVAADLLTSPGRGPQEGELLIEKMKGAENDWRRKP